MEFRVRFVAVAKVSRRLLVIYWELYLTVRESHERVDRIIEERKGASSYGESILVYRLRRFVLCDAALDIT